MSNTTIAEAKTESRTPVVPYFVAPPQFNPPKGNKTTTFLRAYERTATANAWTDALKICHFGTYLVGVANIWYNHLIEEPVNSEKNWTEICQAFKAEFDDEDAKRNLERQLMIRQQGRYEAMKSYFLDLKDLFYEYDPTFDPENFIKFSENGIRTDLYGSYY
ncbi:hypothetical protein JTB14_023770 [Gonioctena quinquepunctata]|nr:hypothetical protein JTB14_023770 [Gonioctena quinquepunctata]